MVKSKSSKPGAARKGGASNPGRISAGPPSAGPPSSQLQTPTSSGGTYAIGALLLAVAMAALLYMKCSGSETTAAPPPPTATATEPTANLPVFAPPPPPEIEEDAGADAGEEDAGKPKQPKTGGPVAAGAGACSACGKGIPSSALTSAVSSTAGLARGCYQRALRSGGAEGGLTVSVSVGAKGNLCGARITNDSLHNPAISSCVLGKFQSRSYPKPQEGCVVVNVPISFKMKTP